MSTIAMSTYSPVPGKEAEAEALLKEGLDLMKKFGGNGHVAKLAFGGMQNTLCLLLEFADPKSYGEGLDAAYAHSASKELMSRGGQAAVLLPAGAADYVEVPGCEVPWKEVAAHGVIAIGTYRIHHGKHAQAHEWMREGKAISEGLGAKVRLLHSRASDPTGVTATVAYYRNFADWANHWAALDADAKWKEYGERVSKHPPHADFLHTRVLRVV